MGSYPLKVEDSEDSAFRELSAVPTLPSPIWGRNRYALSRTCPHEAEIIRRKGVRFVAGTGGEVFMLRFKRHIEVFAIIGPYFNVYADEGAFQDATRHLDLRAKGIDLL
jgi:hypothetical protein